MFYNGLHNNILEDAKDGNGSDYCDAIRELAKILSRSSPKRVVYTVPMLQHNIPLHFIILFLEGKYTYE